MSTNANGAKNSAKKIRALIERTSKNSSTIMSDLESILIQAGVHRELYGDAGLLAEALTATKAILPASKKDAANHAMAWSAHVSGHTFFTRAGAVKAGKSTGDSHPVEGSISPFEFDTPELAILREEKKIKAEERAAKRKADTEEKARELASLKANARPFADLVKSATDSQLVEWLVAIQTEQAKRAESIAAHDKHAADRKAADNRSKNLRNQTAALAVA